MIKKIDPGGECLQGQFIYTFQFYLTLSRQCMQSTLAYSFSRNDFSAANAVLFFSVNESGNMPKAIHPLFYIIMSKCVESYQFYENILVYSEE